MKRGDKVVLNNDYRNAWHHTHKVYDGIMEVVYVKNHVATVKRAAKSGRRYYDYYWEGFLDLVEDEKPS